MNTGSMDNVKLDAAGDLWIGCQPLLYAIIDRLSDSNVICPSEVSSMYLCLVLDLAKAAV